MPKEFNIQDGESIFDLVLSTYGKLDFTYKLILENNQEGGVFFQESIDLELSSKPGFSIQYDDSFVVEEEVLTTKQNVNPPDYTYIIQEGQSLFDVALMVYGDVSKVIKLVQDHAVSINQNPIESINQNVLAGLKVSFDPELIEDKVLLEYLNTNSLVINTSDPKVNQGGGFSSGFKIDAFF